MMYIARGAWTHSWGKKRRGWGHHCYFSPRKWNNNNVTSKPVSHDFRSRTPRPAGRARTPGNFLGATLVDGGIDVAVMAGHATAVEFCALTVNSDGSVSEERYELNGPVQGRWDAFIPGVAAGDRYGFRAYGRWDPASGMTYNPAKLLLDPYGKGIVGDYTNHPAIYAHRVDSDLRPLSETRLPSTLDSAPFVPHSVVVDTDYSGQLTQLYTPWRDTVIYEAHVVGLTKNMPGVPDELRGTYAGVAHPATIAHLKKLGVTALELLPIHASQPEPFLADLGLTNYWGYNTAAFFAPEPSYATARARAAGPGAVLTEVKGMVELLHDAGIEVILDVVYNHTCEGGVDGPTFSWKGLDPTAYYLREAGRPSHFYDVTGTGNSLDFRRRRTVRMALDSLRYWAGEVGIDGFRFDLAVTLARNYQDFSSHHPFLVAMMTDPLLSTLKLINEPWDIGPNGWQTGHFPPGTADWNDRYRDAVRQFWLVDQAGLNNGGPTGDMRELVTRLSGSADMFSAGRIPGGRGIAASINFVTAHDGFTLADLTSYNHKHNEANGENNRDGSNENRSWNHGTEGPDDSLIEARARTMRNMLGTLIFSGGTPMLTAGDEIGRTQGGNNNAYCQDSPISWIDWDTADWQEDLRETVSYLLHLRATYDVLRPTAFYTGTPRPGDSQPDVLWCDPSGAPMPAWKWFDTHGRIVQMYRSDGQGGADALLIINGGATDTEVTLPEGRGVPYRLMWDSAHARPPHATVTEEPGAGLVVGAQTMRLYVSTPTER